MNFARTNGLIIAIACAAVPFFTTGESVACTTIMAGNKATADGSVLMSSSCDGSLMGYAYIMPAQTYGESERIAMKRGGGETGCYLPPVHRTHHSIILGAGHNSEALGGMNEHGVSIGIEFIPMRSELDSTQGIAGPFSTHWTTSLIANGLLRAKSAREAVELIGAMVEQYGFYYTWGGSAGVALPIADGKEIWLMEIFGPAEGWTAGSDEPGGVWCAQRVPDDSVSVSANRSRIGEVDLENKNMFMASSNIHSLAKRLELWEEGEPFIWREVYGAPGNRGTALREWRALSLVAPSQELQDPVDPIAAAYPFSVKPDDAITVERLITIMRDGYEGTPYDVTEHDAFRVRGETSPLARPWGPQALFDVLDVEPERAIATPESNYVFIAQLRPWLPDSIGNVLWYAPGPADSSCFAPIYAGVKALPEAWEGPADFSRINREQVQWNYRLVSNLVTNLNYQEAIQDVLQVVQPAERAFLAMQPEIEKEALHRWETLGREAAEALLTEYTGRGLEQVAEGYHQLVDYLMFQYLYDRPDLAPPSLPSIASPRGPD